MPARSGARQSLQLWQRASVPDMLEVMVSLHGGPLPTSSSSSSVFLIMPFDYSESGFSELSWCKLTLSHYALK